MPVSLAQSRKAYKSTEKRHKEHENIENIENMKWLVNKRMNKWRKEAGINPRTIVL